MEQKLIKALEENYPKCNYKTFAEGFEFLFPNAKKQNVLLIKY